MSWISTPSAVSRIIMWFSGQFKIIRRNYKNYTTLQAWESQVQNLWNQQQFLWIVVSCRNRPFQRFNLESSKSDMWLPRLLEMQFRLKHVPETYDLFEASTFFIKRTGLFQFFWSSIDSKSAVLLKMFFPQSLYLCYVSLKQLPLQGASTVCLTWLFWE